MQNFAGKAKCKIFFMQKSNTQCFSEIKFLNSVVEKQKLCFKLSESKMLSRNLQDVSLECKAEK